MKEQVTTAGEPTAWIQDAELAHEMALASKLWRDEAAEHRAVAIKDIIAGRYHVTEHRDDSAREADKMGAAIEDWVGVLAENMPSPRFFEDIKQNTPIAELVGKLAVRNKDVSFWLSNVLDPGIVQFDTFMSPNVSNPGIMDIDCRNSHIMTFPERLSHLAIFFAHAEINVLGPAEKTVRAHTEDSPLVRAPISDALINNKYSPSGQLYDTRKLLEDLLSIVDEFDKGLYEADVGDGPESERARRKYLQMQKKDCEATEDQAVIACMPKEERKNFDVLTDTNTTIKKLRSMVKRRDKQELAHAQEVVAQVKPVLDLIRSGEADRYPKAADR